VIGAGPAGLIAAYEIAKEGHDVVVLEEHKSVGEPVHCAGLLSLSGLKSIGLEPPQSTIQNQVKGARIFSPNGNFIEIERGKREAYVIDRAQFDNWLAERAADNGATLLTQTRVSQLIQKKQRVVGVRIGNEDRKLEATIVINSEGVNCVLSSSAGMPTVARKSKLPAYQYEITGVEIDDDLVEMYYGRDTAPGFFAWIIPLGENSARVGLASRTHSKQRLQNFIRHNRIVEDKIGKSSIIKGFGGIVHVGLPVKRTWKTGLLTVGDAAGQVKATTGGGVIMGGIAARIAGMVSSKILTESLTEEREYHAYEQLWRGQILNELRIMYLAQRGLTSLSDKGLNTLIRNINDLDLVSIVREEGDMDRQKQVLFSLMKNPRMLPLGLNLLRYLNPFIH